MKFLAEKGLSKLFELFYHFFEKLMGEDSKEGSMSSRLFLNSIKGLNKIFGGDENGNLIEWDITNNTHYKHGKLLRSINHLQIHPLITSH